MPGPIKKSSRLKGIEGGRGKQKKPNPPRFVGPFGYCPRHLKGHAKECWRLLAPELEKENLSAKVYRLMLEGLCQAYARARKADESLEGLEELTFRTENGYVAVHPAVSISNNAWSSFRAFGAEFGLSPKQIANIEKQPEKPTSLRDQLMS